MAVSDILKWLGKALVWLFLAVMVAVSVAIGISAIVSVANGRSVSDDIHGFLTTDGGNIVALVVALVVMSGGTLFWVQEMMEPEHKVVSENNILN